MPRRAGRPTEWTEERIRSELQTFLAGRYVWPPSDDFMAAGQAQLRNAVQRYGGVAHWAREIGVEAREHRGGGNKRWTDERIRRELEEFLADKATYPRGAEFAAASRVRLFAAISEGHGVAHWASQLGVPLRERATKLSDDEIMREVRRVIDAEWYLPNTQRLRELGYLRLAYQLRKSGGAVRFARERGLPTLQDLRLQAAA